MAAVPSGHPNVEDAGQVAAERDEPKTRDQVAAHNFTGEKTDRSLGARNLLLANCVMVNSSGWRMFVYDVDFQLRNARTEQLLEKNLHSDHRKELFWLFVEKNRKELGGEHQHIVFDDVSRMLITRPLIGEEAFQIEYRGDRFPHGTLVDIQLKSNGSTEILDFDATQGLKFEALPELLQNIWTQHLRGPDAWCRKVEWLGLGNRLYKVSLNRVHRPLEPQFIAHNLDLITELVRGLEIRARRGPNGRVFLNLALLHGVMLKLDLPLIQFFAFMQKDKFLTDQALDQLARSRLSFNPHQRWKFEECLKNIKLRTKYGNKREYTFFSLATNSAAGTFFRFRGRRMSVQQYFERHEIAPEKLRFPHLPLVVMQGGTTKEGKPKTLEIPMELLRVPIRKQSLAKRLTEAKREEICTKATLCPGDHFRMLEKMFQAAHLAPNDPQRGDVHRQADSFGLLLDCDENGKPNWMQVEGRVQTAPACVYDTGLNDRYPLDNPVIEPCPEFLLVPCVVNGRDEVVPSRIVHELRQAGNKVGLDFLVSQQHVDCSREYFDDLAHVRGFMAFVKNKYSDWNPKPILLLFFLDKKPDETYDLIKYCGDVEFGFPTQCIRLQDWTKQGRVFEPQHSMIAGVIAKINFRMGGVQNRVDSAGSGRFNRSNETFDRFTNDRNSTLFIGIHSTKPNRMAIPTEHLTVLSACFNCNLEATKFATVYKFEEEECNDFLLKVEDLAYDTLLMFYGKTKALPHNLLVYRGSVSEVVVNEVEVFERDLIKKAWERVIRDRGLEWNDLHLLYVNVHRDQMRFTKAEAKTNELGAIAAAQARNPDRGTVVDDLVTSPEGNDFYLCSHAGLKGTSRPTHYVKLFDDWNVKWDDLYVITYCLCFLVQRSVYSISLPAPLYYAKLQCIRVRDYMKAMPKNTYPHQLTTHENLKYSPIFT